MVMAQLCIKAGTLAGVGYSLFNTKDAINTAEVKPKNNLSNTETPFLNSS